MKKKKKKNTCEKSFVYLCHVIRDPQHRPVSKGERASEAKEAAAMLQLKRMWCNVEAKVGHNSMRMNMHPSFISHRTIRSTAATIRF